MGFYFKAQLQQMPYLFAGGGGVSIRIAPEITWWWALIRVVFQIGI